MYGTLTHPALRLRTWYVPSVPYGRPGLYVPSPNPGKAWDLPVYNDPYDDVRTHVQPGLLLWNTSGRYHGDMQHIIRYTAREIPSSQEVDTDAKKAYVTFATHSAWYMWKVYEKRRIELGQPPSVAYVGVPSGNNQVIIDGPDLARIIVLHKAWYALSKRAFIRWDEQEKQMAAVRDEFKSIEGIPVYTPDMIRTYDLGERLRDENRTIEDLREVEAQALMTLTQHGGYTNSQILAISRRTATDPVGTRLIDAFVGEVVASQDPGGRPLTDVATTGQQTGAQPSVITPNTGSAQVIDDIGSRLLNQAGLPTPSTQVIQAQTLPIDPNIRARDDLPAGSRYDNVLTQQEEAARLAESATRELAYFDPNLYRLSELTRTRRDRHWADMALWRVQYPKVEILASENPNFDPKLLEAPWDGSAFAIVYNGQNLFGYGNVGQASQIPPSFKPRMLPEPPLVLVTITPRTKPMPNLSFVASNKWLGAILGVIPGIGAFLATAWQVAQMTAQREYSNEVNAIIANIRSHADDIEVSKWAMPSSAFEPQYLSQPFPIVLPLDAAQFAVKEPWYVTSLNEWFTLEANKKVQI